MAHDVQQSDDIVVVDLLQKLDLPQRSPVHTITGFVPGAELYLEREIAYTTYATIIARHKIRTFLIATTTTGPYSASSPVVNSLKTPLPCPLSVQPHNDNNNAAAAEAWCEHL